MGDLKAKFEQLRKDEFKRIGKRVYLDHTGSALYMESHLKKHFHELEENLLGNPHSGNSCSERMNDIIYQVRLSVLQFFDVTLDEYDVVFTSGATDALRLISFYFDWKSGSIFAYVEDNHTSVVGIRDVATSKGADCYCVCKSAENASSFKKLGSYEAKLIKTATRSNDVDSSLSIPCLFAYAAQSNFSGAKYPLKWIKHIQKYGYHIDTSTNDATSLNRKWYVLCDAAAYVSTSHLDLSKFYADFVTVSFYKIFGYPTGLGALLVRKSSEDVLCNKTYFGGGSVSGWLSSHNFFSPKPTLHDRMEDGSMSFLSILALKNGFDTFKEFGITMDDIHVYAHGLWLKLYQKVKNLKHYNGANVAEIYLAGEYDVDSNGPILAFNIKRSDGSYIGYNHVLQLANSNDIYLRGGCFCNIGACVSLLATSNEILLSAFGSGHTCGDAIDIVDGKPIGALRASLGFSSTENDIDTFVEFLWNCVRETNANALTLQNSNGRCTKNVILDEIIIYPVKSCQGMSVDNWEISNTGLKYDRMWMIVDEHGICVNLKNCPHLVSIYPEVDCQNSLLVLRADGMKDIKITFLLNPKQTPKQCNVLKPNQSCVSKVCGDKVDAFDCGDEVSLWLSEVLGKTCFLLQKNFNVSRFSNKKLQLDLNDNYQLSLANEAQYLLINRSSVEYLCNDLLASDEMDADDENVDNLIKRFRANFVISGAPPFAEDSWEKLSFDCGGKNPSQLIEFTKSGLCHRCSVICVDPYSGQKLNGPLKVLAKLTRPDNCKRKPTFGVYLQCSSPSISIKTKSEIFPS